MSVLDFARTAMGHTFLVRTMPKIADELAQLNTNIEALVAEFRASNRQAEATRGGIAPTPSPGDVVR